jgi:hypothetical protein
VRQARGPIINAAAHPNGGAALKLVCPALKNAGLRWRRAVERTAVMGRFPTQLGSVLRNPRNDLGSIRVLSGGPNWPISKLCKSGLRPRLPLRP